MRDLARFTKKISNDIVVSLSFLRRYYFCSN